MKICTKCKTLKELSEYYKDKTKKDGISPSCKKCSKLAIVLYTRTKIGLISTIYVSQKKRSIIKGFDSVSYSKEELLEWLMNDWLFDLLYTNWTNCGYIKAMIPSIDRLDDNKGYSFDNIQLMTWGENNAKGRMDMRSGKLINTSKPQKAVFQFTMNKVFIREFVSICEAERQTGTYMQNISTSCKCENFKKSAGGFKWRFKEQ